MSIATTIQMVDLQRQYQRIKGEIDEAIQNCINNTTFIKGPQVVSFQENFQKYLGVKYVIPCANGTDALQIAMMAAGLKKDDEVIVPAFTYVATAEVIGLLGYKPVMIDVDPHSYNITRQNIEAAISENTKAIVPVHLFGQSTDMAMIMDIAKQYDLFVIEDTAQAIGADFIWNDGKRQKVGTMGHIGCTSFFPSKNLGCFGDGGALFTNDHNLAQRCRMIANHGQSKQYHHEVIGINSRLDSLQAAILDVKLKYLDDYKADRQTAAQYYDTHLKNVSQVSAPYRSPYSTHVFHQYTIQVLPHQRDGLKQHLADNNIPSMIYYPKPLHHQQAFKELGRVVGDLEVSTALCKKVLSLPMHTELTTDEQDYIIDTIKSYFK